MPPWLLPDQSEWPLPARSAGPVLALFPVVAVVAPVGSVARKAGPGAGRLVSATAAATAAVPAALFPAARRRNIASRAGAMPTEQWREWCFYCRSSVVHIATAPRMYSLQRSFEILRQLAKWQTQRRPTANQHI